MSAFHEAVRRDLVCPVCQERNDERRQPIEVDLLTWLAYCQTCSRSGPIDTFQTKKGTAT